MPYIMSKEGERWCVRKEQDGALMKCYRSRRRALAYLRALNAAADDEQASEISAEAMGEVKMHSYTYNGVSVKASRRRTSTRADKKYMRFVEKDDKVYVVHYGDPEMPMRRANPKARANFTARHNCSEKTDPLKAGFWACLDWERPKEEMQMPMIATSEQQKNGRVLVRIETVYEMGGQSGVDYPDIPVPSDVDVAGLAEVFGEKPVFVILPIAQINARSRNDRIYTERAIHSLVEQVNALRPEGIRGHLRDDEIATRYDAPQIRWLKAEIHGDLVFGLALALTKESRDYYRAAMKTNAQVGTSLFAWADMEDNKVIDLELISIDQADPRRVGIPVTAAKPLVKHEMVDEMQGEESMSGISDTVQAQINFVELREQRMQLQNRVAELEQRIEQLAPYEDDVRELCRLFGTQEQSALVPTIKSQQAALTELYGLFGAKDMSSFKAAVTQMHAVSETMISEAKALLESVMRAAVEQKIAVPALRELAVELAMRANPRTRAEAEAALEAVYRMPAMQSAIANAILAQSGGVQPSVRSASGDDEPKSWKIKGE